MSHPNETGFIIESGLQSVMRSLAWSEDLTLPDGTWAVELERVPSHGLYRWAATMASY